jgi:hypothetical protein
MFCRARLCINGPKRAVSPLLLRGRTDILRQRKHLADLGLTVPPTLLAQADEVIE